MREVVELDKDTGWVIIDIDNPSRTVDDKYIKDIQILSVSTNKTKKYEDGVSVEVIEFIEGKDIGVSKVRFKGLK